MRSRLKHFMGLLSATSVLALLFLSTSIAEGPVLTSSSLTPEDKSAAPIAAVGRLRQPVAASIPSSQKRKNTAAVKATLLASAWSDGANLLPIVEHPSIKQHHRVLADKVLRALPSGCRDNLKNFYVRYDNPKNRGLGGKTTIILDGNVPDSEFMALLTHECAHVIHSNMLGKPSSGATAFKDGVNPIYKDSPAASFFALAWENENVLRAGMSGKDFVSGYAQNDTFEDFAETFAAYVLHPQALEAQAKDSGIIAGKLQWMRLNMPLSQAVSVSSYSWNGKAPWDVTKLPYVWTVSTPVALR